MQIRSLWIAALLQICLIVPHYLSPLVLCTQHGLVDNAYSLCHRHIDKQLVYVQGTWQQTDLRALHVRPHRNSPKNRELWLYTDWTCIMNSTRQSSWMFIGSIINQRSELTDSLWSQSILWGVGMLTLAARHHWPAVQRNSSLLYNSGDRSQLWQSYSPEASSLLAAAWNETHFHSAIQIRLESLLYMYMIFVISDLQGVSMEYVSSVVDHPCIVVIRKTRAFWSCIGSYPTYILPKYHLILDLNLVNTNLALIGW